MSEQKQFKGLSTAKLNELLREPGVRSELRKKANRVLPRTKAVAYQAGAGEFAKALRVSDGVRPGAKARGGLKRSYARIGATMTDEMKRKDARARMTRRMILRRGSNA